MKLVLVPTGAAVCLAGVWAAVALAGGQDKVTICHKPDNQTIELSVGDPAVDAHLAHGDTLGPCEGTTTTTPTETTPTETTPTTTTPTTTTPTTTTPPPGSGGSSGSAGVYCDFDHYVVTGTVDGLPADSADPGTIAGNYNGWTNVTLHRGDTSFRTAVFTYGDCLGAGALGGMNSLKLTGLRLNRLQ